MTKGGKQVKGEGEEKKEGGRGSREDSLRLILLNVVQPVRDIYCIIGILPPFGGAKPVGEGNLDGFKSAALVQLSMAASSRVMINNWVNSQ